MRKTATAEIPSGCLPLPEMLGNFAGPSAARHHWQTTGRHTIVHEVDLNDTRPNAGTTTSCCENALCPRKQPGYWKSKPNVRVPEVLSPEEYHGSSGCEGDHHECTAHSPHCHAEGTEVVHDNAPCDCCRHGHSLSSLIRPDDCRSCVRHMGGAYISPRYPQLRQRMLTTLKQRRDNSQEVIMEKKGDVASLKTQLGRKEKIVEVVPIYHNEDVDDIVRLIEGTKISNDPRKAAKKARQKEKKIQTKLEEERQKETEERRKREEEERLRKEQEMREEEERRKAEELKRQARKLKKKNRKKRDAANPNGETVCAVLEAPPLKSELKKIGLGETLAKEYGAAHPISCVMGGNSGSTSTQRVAEQTRPVPDLPNMTDDSKPRMVTIRRHPSNSDNQNVVTITLNDENDGTYPVYMLVNGQLYMSEPGNPTVEVAEQPVGEAEDSTAAGKKKKKKKKKNGLNSTNEQLTHNTGQLSDVSNKKQLSHSHNGQSQIYGSDDEDDDDTVDLGTLNLPPGITITKVPSVLGDFNKKPASSLPNDRGHSMSKESYCTSSSGSGIDTGMIDNRKYGHHLQNDEDIFCRTENEEFEEVISSKTRRKRIKAAKSKELDGMDEGENIRISLAGGSQISHSRRQQTNGDKLVENGSASSKWTNGGKTGKSKSTRSNQKSTGNFEKTNNHLHPGGRQNAQSRNNENFHHGCCPVTGAAVMPRLSRTAKKNGNGLSWSPSEASQLRSSGSSIKNERHQHSPQLVNNNLVSPRDNSENYAGVPHHGGNVQFRRDEGGFSNDSSNLQIRSHSRTSSVNPNQPQPQSVAQQPVMKLWDHGEFKAAPSFQAPPLGPFTVQADPTTAPDDCWNPWKDWSEHSTPENPSPRFGLESRDCNQKEVLPKTYSFHELMRKTTGKSPIQRPQVSGNLDMADCGVSRDMYYHPQVANGCEFDSAKYFMQQQQQQAQTPGSHTNERSDLNMKCSPPPLNSLHKESKPQFGGPHTNPFFPKEEPSLTMYNLKMATNNMEEPSWNSFKPGIGMQQQEQQQQPYLQRGSSDKSDFLLTQAVLNSSPCSDQNQKWGNYSGDCSPIQESDMIYNQHHVYGSGIPDPQAQNSAHEIFKNSWSSPASSEEIDMRQPVNNEEPIYPNYKTYTDIKLGQLTSTWQKGRSNTRVPTTRVRTLGSSQNTWDNGNIQFCPDFTAGGAHH